MAKKKWIDWSDQCPNCGDAVEICTDAEQDNIFPVAYDGDAAKCVSCKWEGGVMVDEGVARLDDGNLDKLDEMDSNTL
jgi:hypothetical protein